MSNTSEHRCIAIAGIFQSVESVQQVAFGSTLDDATMEVLIGSVLRIDSNSVEEVYGGIAGVQRGLTHLQDYLVGTPSAKQMELIRYAINLIQLEHKLFKQVALVRTLHDRIVLAQEKARSESSTSAAVTDILADAYQSTVSKISPRIMVHGEPSVLANQLQANKIRALLMAGIRAAVLWRQCGGKRLLLIFQRRQILADAHRLLATIKQPANSSH